MQTCVSEIPDAPCDLRLIFWATASAGFLGRDNKHPQLQVSAERVRNGVRHRLKVVRYRVAVKLGPGLSFSWKRALGVTRAKRKISKATGIPLTRSGRRNKLGKWLGMR